MAIRKRNGRYKRVIVLAKKLADFTCSTCGKSFADHPERTRLLETHHIVPLSLGGAKYDISNMLVLCGRFTEIKCHVELHRKENLANGGRPRKKKNGKRRKTK
jgi:5-methylcytosine-specific restriction endonuclease McrA